MWLKSTRVRGVIRIVEQIENLRRVFPGREA
jgi:hypothetical protein